MILRITESFIYSEVLEYNIESPNHQTFFQIWKMNMDYTKCTSIQLKKLLGLRKIPDRSLITKKEHMIIVLKRYDENPNDTTGLKTFIKSLCGLESFSQIQYLSEDTGLSLSNLQPSQDLFSNYDDGETQSMMSDVSMFSDLSMLPDVVPTEVQYPNLKTNQDIVRLEMPRNDYELLRKMVDDYEKLRHKKYIYDQNAKNKRIQQRNLMFVHEGKHDKVKPLCEIKPFVKQMTLDKYIL